MEAKSYSIDFFETMQEISSNSKCCDCGSVDASYASLLHAVFICKDCSDIHNEIGDLSKSVEDEWENIHLTRFNYGGNKRFLQFMQKYDLEDKTIQEKYSSNAAHFYRKKVFLNQLFLTHFR
jgi:hypothetical protein